MNSFKTRIKGILKIIIRAAIIIHLVLLLILSAVSVYFRNNNPGTTSLMFYRNHLNGHTVREVRFIDISAVPARVLDMFVSVEDPGFYNHHGIQIRAIASAYRLNRKLGYNKWGGSTITQQLARTLILWPGKTYFRKYIEILTAFSMEIFMSKKRILELYVNYIEFGPGIFGIGSASLFHFQKPFAELDYHEIAMLISILPSPIKYSPQTLLSNDHLKKRFFYLINKYAGTENK